MRRRQEWAVDIPRVFARALSAALGTNLRGVIRYGRVPREESISPRSFRILVIVLQASSATSATVRRVASRLEKETRVDVICRVVDVNHFAERRDADQPFWLRIKRDGVQVWPEAPE